jgi:hypothetical protein
MKKQLTIVMALCALTTTSFAADAPLGSEQERTDLIIKFDKNKDKALDMKELGDIKQMKPKAHMILVDYCKLLKAKPESFGVKAVDMKTKDGKAKPEWACSDKRVAAGALDRWIKKKAQAGSGATTGKAPATRSDAVKAIDMNGDKLLDQPEAQKLLASYPKMHAGLMQFCGDVKKAPVKYGLKPADIRTADGKAKPGWVCNGKKVGKAALNKWISTGVKPAK